MGTGEILERQRELILQNELVEGNEEIADIICKKGKFVSYNHDHLLIKKGDEEDTVYFILNGTVAVQKYGQVIDDKSALNTVGELSAKLVGSKRTADVIVSSPKADFLKLSGLLFRQLIKKFPSFKEKLNLKIDSMNREKISQIGEPSQEKQISWIAISLSIAIILIPFTGLLAWNWNFSWEYIILSIVGTFVSVFLLILFANPTLIYKNMFRISGFSLITLVLYGTCSVVIKFQNLNNISPYILDFSAENSITFAQYSVSLFILLLLCVISGYLDQNSSHKQNV